MDILDEVKQEVERDKLRNFFVTNSKIIFILVSLFVAVVTCGFLFNNYQISKNLKSYEIFYNNAANSFQDDISINETSNSTDVIHFINKYSFLNSSGEIQQATELLNKLNYNNIKYPPFKELVFIYDNNREGQNNGSPIFISESQFIDILKLINSDNLESANTKLSELLNEPSSSSIIKTKAQELQKLVQFKIDEKTS
jgi:hypothetical protein